MENPSRLSESALPADIMNKADWHEYVPVAVNLAHQTDQPLSSIFIDINRFKEVNDTLGHDAGDQAIDGIKQVVGFLTSQLRTEASIGQTEDDDNRGHSFIDELGGDIIGFDSAGPTTRAGFKSVDAAHVGGDEFAILAGTDETGARQIIDRLRMSFTDWIDQPENSQLKNIGIGIAIGAATLKPDMDAKALLQAADEAMYADKIEQLPPLNEHEKAVLQLAKIAIEGCGLRMRDLLKYEQLLDNESSH